MKTRPTTAVGAPFKRIALFAFASALLAIFASGCGTVRGIGHDVSHAGDHIEDAAQ